MQIIEQMTEKEIDTVFNAIVIDTPSHWELSEIIFYLMNNMTIPNTINSKLDAEWNFIDIISMVNINELVNDLTAKGVDLEQWHFMAIMLVLNTKTMKAFPELLEVAATNESMMICKILGLTTEKLARLYVGLSK